VIHPGPEGIACLVGYRFLVIADFTEIKPVDFLTRFRDSGKPDVTESVPRGEFVREFASDGYVVQVDESQQMLKLHAVDEIVSQRIKLKSTFASLPQRKSSQRFVSASMLAFKAKQFEDGLYAAVETAAQRGTDKYPGKIALFRELTQVLARDRLQGEMSAVIFAAARLGAISVEQPCSMDSAVTRQIDRFLADENASKVLGFYTWTEELSRIFRQDRLLQSKVSDLTAVDEAARALRACGPAYATYVAYLALISRLTNPVAAENLCDWLNPPVLDNAGPARFCSFFPPSRSYETDLVKQLYANVPVPEGFNLAREMVQRIRDGRISLKPTEQSGWYDYQTWALEPLVLPEKMPEAAKLTFSKEYREHLVELLKGVIALTRETHVKDLEIAASLARGPLGPLRRKIYVRPRLSLEPLAAFYERRAIAYSFIREVLLDIFGPDGLKKIRRMTPDGPVELPLEDELVQMITLFRGAHDCVNCQLALPSTDGTRAMPDSSAAISIFQDWVSKLDDDSDLARDPRMMVPVFYDVPRQKTKVWVILGWGTRLLSISYVNPPMVQVKTKNGNAADKEVDIEFSSQHEFAAYPVFAEVYVSRLLNREEFQKHCDRHGTREEILANLT